MSPLPDYDAVPVRRAPLPPRAALARFFPSSSPTLGVSLPSSRADRAAPNPPDASPRPHLTRRRRSAVSEPGSDPVACGSATSTFRATSVATRACATSSKSLSGTRATGVGSSPTPRTATNSCVISASDLTRRARPMAPSPSGSPSAARRRRCEGLIDVDGVIRGGVGQLVRPEEDFWQDATPENTFTLRVASCAAAGGDRDRDRDRDAHAVRSRVRRLARWKIASVVLPEVFAALATIDRGGYVEAAVRATAKLVRETRLVDFVHFPTGFVEGVQRAPGATTPELRAESKAAETRKTPRRSRVSRRTSRRIRRITWRRIP